MIVGTAGHIDHGKTTLVRALTGVDTDRLPEEKRRGITIELGFAPLVLDGVGTVGVVDVPGHEAFVRTMLAGAAGIDVGLLVVAADDGVQPQTREHLAILQLLDVRGGVIALTKCDLAEDDWIGLVEEDLRDLTRGTVFADAPIVRVSPGDVAALSAMRVALAAALRHAAARDPADLFRLPVDRVFSVHGTGTVVTGTAWSGSLARDAQVRILPSGRSVRVRGIQNHGAAAERALPGQRTALALAGVEVSDLGRGDVLVTDPAWEPSLVIRADATLLADAPRSLGPRTAVRLHLGTAEVGARVVGIGGLLAPGETRPVRIALDAPIVARGGDRFVLRFASPLATIGGGVVTDALAPRRGRPFGAAGASIERRLERLLAEAGPRGVPLASIPIRLGASAAGAAAAARATNALTVEGSGRIVAGAVMDAAIARLVELVDAHHRSHPLSTGTSLQELRSRLRVPEDLAEAVVQHGVAAGALETNGGEIRRRGWAPRLTAGQEDSMRRVLERLSAAGAEPPSTGELTTEFGPDTPSVLRLMVQRGEIVQVEVNRYYTKHNLDEIITGIRGACRRGSAVTPSALRDATGLSRKYLIPLLEYCDRMGLTVRTGEGRVWGGPGGGP
jgi:selenocysteine-specific elongation factor